MKNRIVVLFALIACCMALEAQIKKPVLNNSNVKNPQLNQGIKVANIKKLSTADLSKLKLPSINITEAQKKSKALTSWKITPMRLKDTYLEVTDFFGFGMKDRWEIHSMPWLEGYEVTKWNSGFLWLKFRQSKDIEYRLRIKLKGTNYRGKEIYLQIDDFSARYPVNPNDGTVNTVWTASRTNSNSSIVIGQLMKTSGSQNQRHPFPVTKIEYVLIEKISR